MATKNVTLRLDADLLKKWRRFVLEEDTTLSQWVTDAVTEVVSKDEAYQAAKKKALEWLRKGVHMEGGNLSREDLHER